MAKSLKDGHNTSGREKAFYGIAFFGQNIFYGLVALNTQVLFSDVGITAASIAVILLITRIWDAVNDPLFGIIMDRIRLKRGRFLPWLRISIPLIFITSMALFLLPLAGDAPMLKIVWAVVAYVAWDMSYTLCDVPLFVLPTSMTDNIKERSGILAIGRYLGTFGIMAVMMLMPVLQAALGWVVVGIVLSILGLLFMLPSVFIIKERHIVRPEKAVTFKDMARYVLGNKYLLIFFVGMIFSYATNFSQTIIMFFARINLGDQTLGTLVTMATVIPSLIIGAFIPMITKRVDKFLLFVYANIAVAIFGIIRYFIGYGNFAVFMAAAFVQGIAMSATTILIFMFTPDCLEYGTYHSGTRAEGVAASVQTFFTKLLGSISGPLAMIILSFFGFVTGESAAQPQSAVDGLWLCMTVFPAIGIAIACAIWSQYKLRDKDVQVMAEYNSGVITKAEAEEKLAARYGSAADLVKMTITSVE